MLHSLIKNTNVADYPYQLELKEPLDLNHQVIFLTGDNGSGKSTLLKILASISESIPVAKNSSKEELFNITDEFTLSWTTRLKKGMWFQSEDFLSFLSWANQEQRVYEELSKDVDERHNNKQSMGYILEKNLQEYNRKSMKIITDTMHTASHGEGVLEYFKTKLRANTLYLLDEPEAPLSFENQLSLMILIHDVIQRGSQFIICTHSPILLGYPKAQIYHLENKKIIKKSYEEHSLVKDYKYFIENPDRYLRHIFQ